MKTLVCYFVLMMLFLGANAQQLKFRNFKELEHEFLYLDVWIAPLDIEQQFKPFQREVKKNGLYLHSLGSKSPKDEREVDSLVCADLKRRGIDPKEYLKGSEHPLMKWLTNTLSIKVENPVPQEWLQAMPATLKTQMEERAEKEKLHWNNDFFTVYALVNNQGEVLTVYFNIDAMMLDLIREEDLQAIYDGIMGTPFNPDNFEFRYADQKVMEAAFKKLLSPGIEQEMTPQERYDSAMEAIKPVNPGVHGIIKVMSMHRARPMEEIKMDENPFNRGRFAPAIPTEKEKNKGQ